jgi:hypothetical protein
MPVSRHDARNRSMGSRMIGAIALTATLATAAGACSDDSAPNVVATSAPPGATAAPTAAPPTTLTTADRSTTSTPTNGSLPSTGNAEIDALLAAERTANYHVIYVNDQGESLEVLRDGARLAVYQRSQSLHQMGDGRNFQCDTIEGGRCLPLPDGLGSIDTVLSAYFAGFGAALAGSENITGPFAAGATVSEDTVAGRRGRCAKVTSGEQSYAVCIDAEIGILLRSISDPGDGTTTTFAASTVEVGTVTAADLELPATIVGT